MRFQRSGILAAALAVLLVSPAFAIQRGGRGGPGGGGFHAGPGRGHGFSGGGPRGGFHGGFRGGFRGNHFNVSLGFRHRRHWSHVDWSGWGYPGYTWGFPGYAWGGWSYPAYGYPVVGYPWVNTAWASPYFGSPWLGGLAGYGVLGPTLATRQWGYGYAPAVVDASQVIVNQPPPAGYLREVPAHPDHRFYLDQRPTAPTPTPAPASLVDLARAQIRVEEAEKGAYLVRWTGPPEDLALVEFQAVDATGQVLGSRLLREAPYRGLLRTPEKTAAVLITVEQKSGASATVKLPLAEFQALDRK